MGTQTQREADDGSRVAVIAGAGSPTGMGHHCRTHHRGRLYRFREGVMKTHG
jgi:hypothetical protein